MQNSWRLYTLWFLLSVALAGILWRLVDLNILDRTFLLRQSKARILRKINIPAYRGMITDLLVAPLAISTPVDSVWVNPQLFPANAKQLKQLSAVLSLSPGYIKRRAHKANDRQFVYLRRSNPPFVAKQIKSLKIPGVFLQREYRRYYPEGEIGICKAIPDEIIKTNSFRKYNWVTSHLKTFYAGLFKRIKLYDLQYDGKFFSMANDVAMMMPMLEMARNGHIKFISDILYVYNHHNPLSNHNRNRRLQWQLTWVTYARKPYESIDNFNYSPTANK